jgi:hypothetical protein
VVVNKVDGQIICTLFINGRCHVFRLFKVSKLKIGSKIKVLVDAGYVGITKFHVDSVIPVKWSKKKLLAVVDKVFNHRVLSECVLDEYVVGLIKRFNFVSDRYCNCR